jgi:hypothetical protein
VSHRQKICQRTWDSGRNARFGFAAYHLDHQFSWQVVATAANLILSLTADRALIAERNALFGFTLCR